MLAGDQRLRRRSEFSAAMRAGRRAGRGVLVVHLATPSMMALAGRASTMAPAGDASSEVSASPPRAGFVIPKAVGSAVVRNTVRRRLRHLVRERLPGLPAGTDLVVRALPGAADRSYEQLGTDLTAAIAAATRTREVRP